MAMTTATRANEDATPTAYATAAIRTHAPLLALLALARVFAAVALPGMVHPDEFFQSQEVMARHVLESDPVLQQQLWLPWEYELPTPNRSVLFPALVAGLPYHVMRWLGVAPSGFLLLTAPRLVLCFASFFIDWVLYAVARKLRRPAPLTPVLCFATAWPTLVLLTRSFSNTLETLVLALCVAALVLGDPHRRVGVFHVQTIRLGALLALGVFTRFTFALFFAPIGLELARQQDALLCLRHRKKTDGEDVDTAVTDGPRSRHAGVSVLARLAATLWLALQGFVAFAVCAGAVAVLDTLYFLPETRALAHWRHGRALAALIVAPLHNLQYNLQYDNLALHGVHARVTHALVNMPLLFGPLALQFVASCVVAPVRAAWTSSSAPSPASPVRSAATSEWFSALCVLMPLAGLSLAPHQEPRFLLPLTVPLLLSAAPAQLLTRRARWCLWLAFNAIVALFFGVLHQGGVVPMLLALSRHASDAPLLPLPLQLTSSCAFDAVVAPLVPAVPIVFYKTYMPPRFLLAGVQARRGFRVIDLASGGASAALAFARALEQPTGHGGSRAGDAASGSSPERLTHALLVAPASVSIDAIATSARVRASKRVGHCAPHVSTEDFALDRPFALELHLLTLA